MCVGVGKIVRYLHAVQDAILMWTGRGVVYFRSGLLARMRNKYLRTYFRNYKFNITGDVSLQRNNTELCYLCIVYLTQVTIN